MGAISKGVGRTGSQPGASNGGGLKGMNLMILVTDAAGQCGYPRTQDTGNTQKPKGTSRDMVTEVGLSSSVSTWLSSTQRIAELLVNRLERIATGRRVNSPVENTAAFNVATSLSNRASNLLQVKNTLS